MSTNEDKRRQRIQSHFHQSMEVKRQTLVVCEDTILAAAHAVAESLRSDGKVLLCGNGGSAADCQHVAAEFMNLLNKGFERPGLAAIALTTDTSFLTAFSNDTDFEGVFERQVQTLGKAGDVLIGISTSGNSANVIRAVRAAEDLDMTSVVLTGQGGQLPDIADIAIRIPSDNTQFIQEAHLTIEHLVCDLVERELFEVHTQEESS